MNVYGEENNEIVSIDDFDFSKSGQVLNEAGYQELSVRNIINNIITGNFSVYFNPVSRQFITKQ